jgi:hypothetical protein
MRRLASWRNRLPSRSPTHVRLANLGLRVRERFLYEYDFTDGWQHDVRLEQILPLEPRQRYPICIGGRRATPPEDCGGPWAFLELRQHYSAFGIAPRLLELLKAITVVADNRRGDGNVHATTTMTTLLTITTRRSCTCCAC